ncbi:hypothetical protein Clacol_004282 [Clathrus columnatus]|uniref:Uncharacterized protein n=1 Tax=Clathrus columnatus TaxID=1419009 RepID=A0AAV5AC42_9AGAM|nr:hypothetical protein Clacol_004282 [Clathrus columnatus]
MSFKPLSTQAAKPRRPLTLHVSALSNAEYMAYTNWLAEIVGPLNGVQSTTSSIDGGGFGNDHPIEDDEKMIKARASDFDWDPEETLVSVREARGWIRGRWGNGVHALDGTLIDSILRNFSPELAPQDVLTGGQFFAVMRLVCHAQTQVKSQEGQGKKVTVDRSLVFLQANPNCNPEARIHAHKKEKSASSVVSDTSSAAKKPKQPPPIPPPRHSSELSPGQVPVANSNVTSDATYLTASSPSAPALPPRMSHSSVGPNPFMKHTLSSVPESSRNPFRLSKPSPLLSGPRSASVSGSDESINSSPPKRQDATPTALPPLPPRKPAILPPPRHASTKPILSPSLSHATSTTTYVAPPLPPPAPLPKPPKVTSPLIKQSLEAAKGAQSIKAVMDSLGRERQLEVIKKSGNTNTWSAGPHHQDRERATARSMSPPRSMYDVATARLASSATRSSFSTSTSVSTSASSISSQASSSGPSTGIAGSKPKLYADTTLSSLSVSASRTAANTNISNGSPFSPSSPANGNPRRTKSLHHPSPSTAAIVSGSAFPFDKPKSTQPPPPPRRRPESIQVFRSVNETDTTENVNNTTNPFISPGKLTQDWPPPKLASSTIVSPSRRVSTSTVATHSSEPTHTVTSPTAASAGTAVFDTLQRTFSTLTTLKQNPGFESARIRAEGRVLPSGFSKVGGKGERGRLMDDVDDDQGLYQRGRQSATVSKDDTGLSTLSSISGLSQESGRDDLKVPVHPDEGWISLS